VILDCLETLELLDELEIRVLPVLQDKLELVVT